MADQPPAKQSSLSELLAQIVATENAGKVTQQKVEEWLRPRAREWPPICPICGVQNWNIGPDVVFPPLWNVPSDFEEKPYSYPVIIMSCGYCGYVLYFNAVLMGLVPPVRK